MAHSVGQAIIRVPIDRRPANRIGRVGTLRVTWHGACIGSPGNRSQQIKELGVGNPPL
ncbi:hypothetical protein RBSWK_02947 [Rhodopirellula baltica SWK14]|uniref:Uncharacterized protein n=1 Tax=Rhodopirellula baltica SWK14 TaxID=993516 RepID=L7CJ53_RHOBT|nr:hypothetical protein RBSWK_02947 [Rhodopirellula baltica SWK14]